MFGGHLPELIILLVVALVIFGPKRLPEIGGATGKAIREFKKGTSEIADDKSAQISNTPPSTEARPAEPAAVKEGDTAAHA